MTGVRTRPPSRPGRLPDGWSRWVKGREAKNSQRCPSGGSCSAALDAAVESVTLGGPGVKAAPPKSARAEPKERSREPETERLLTVRGGRRPPGHVGAVPPPAGGRAAHPVRAGGPACTHPRERRRRDDPGGHGRADRARATARWLMARQAAPVRSCQEAAVGRFQARYPGPDGLLRSAPSTFPTQTDADTVAVGGRGGPAAGDLDRPGRRAGALRESTPSSGSRAPGLAPRTVSCTVGAAVHIVPQLGGCRWRT